ncbi:MarR family winged helix-turn-helix transcriptional regulator [Agromyces mangrovi Wang et al. 2018]|uniref:MarR family winged helix-turn-helix transcriptional regulator n=1 Tax=Agromyces mangrovi TaxID=1858653 RepID=UPI002572CCE6|nr:MarR family winged helix-turn-helix transcriptional regulator [Agromyces mangrovi]
MAEDAGGRDADAVRAVETALEEIRLLGGRRGRLEHAGPRHERGHDGHAHRHGGGRLAGVARGRVLGALARADRPLSIGEVGELVGVDQPRASRLVQALVDAGLAERTADPADARRSAIVVNDAGREALATAQAARRAAIARALEGFDESERERFAELLGRFAAAWPRD